MTPKTFKSTPRFIITPHSVTCVYEGTPYTKSQDDPSFPAIRKALKANQPQKAVTYFDIFGAINKFTKGKVEVKNGILYFEGEELHDTLAKRIVQYITEGFNEKPLIAFLKKVMSNPDTAVRSQLYPFLEHQYITIADDGDFIAYKGVTEDYKDCHTKTFSNKVGTVNKMPRQSVNPDPNQGCSYGFHVGSHAYATKFGPKTVLVKVNPANVVSIPRDESHQKVRCCEYEVVDDYFGALTKAKYTVKRDKVTKLPYVKSKQKRDASGRFLPRGV
jgi:hypothetical protein